MNASKLFLKTFSDGALTIFSESLFHRLTTRLVKKYLNLVVLKEPFWSLKLCPRVVLLLSSVSRELVVRES